jgi:hypothetical protein
MVALELIKFRSNFIHILHIQNILKACHSGTQKFSQKVTEKAVVLELEENN